MLRSALCAFCGRLVAERDLDVNGECRYLAHCATYADEHGLIPVDEALALERAWLAWDARMWIVRSRTAR